MPTQLILPQLDDPAAELTVEHYFHAVGAEVAPGQPIVRVVSQRYEWEIPADSPGTIAEILAAPGSKIRTGAPLLLLRPAARDTDTAARKSSALRATPVARQIAMVHDIDWTGIAGSGLGGRVTRDDVLRAVEADRPVREQGAPEQRTLTDNRRLLRPPQPWVGTAQFNGAESSDTFVPLAITALEVDLGAVVGYVEQHAGRLAKRGLHLDTLACIAFAGVTELAEDRLLNSAWSDNGIILWSRIRLGVSLPERNRGMLVIDGAAELSLQGLARALGGAPSSNTARPTFSISSTTATRWAAPSELEIHSPLLHVGAAEQRPHVVEQGGRATILTRPLAILSLAYDARIVGQCEADAFLRRLKHRLEHFTAL